MYSRDERWAQVKQWAMTYLQQEPEIDEFRTEINQHLYGLLSLFWEQIGTRRQKIAIWLIFYCLSGDLALLDENPRLAAVMQRKCQEFAQQGLFVGHFIGLPQEQSTFSIAQIVE